MAQYKSHSLNLWSIEDNSSKLDVDCHSDRVDFTTTNNQPLKFHNAVHLVHAGGDILNLADNVKTIEQDIVDNKSSADSGIANVQNNLDAYETANNASVATLNATVVQNKATTDAQHASDAAARATLQSDLEAKITAEETARVSADDTLTANLNTEISNRTTADSDEKTRAEAEEAKLYAEVAVERGRLDSLVAGAGVNLDSLKELVDAYNNADSGVLNQVADMAKVLNDLITRVNELTGESDELFVVALETVISGLDMDDTNSLFLSAPFSISYDMSDRYSVASSAMVGWAVIRAETIAVSGGALTNASTDDEVRAYLKSLLDGVYGALVLAGATLDDYRLKYADPEHYLFEINLPAGSKPLFQGVSQSALPDVQWRLSYCSTAGDAGTIYSTIFSGPIHGKTLKIIPSVSAEGVEYPVNGVNGVRDGYKSHLHHLTLK